MNKQVRSAVSDRRQKLEAELIEDKAVNPMVDDIAEGRAAPLEQQQLNRPYVRRNRHFQIKQGLRRKHPYRVLNQYDALQKTHSSAKTNWEKTMMYENERVELPQEFHVEGVDKGMANQMGIATVALDNYKKSKEKLMRMHLVGV